MRFSIRSIATLSAAGTGEDSIMAYSDAATALNKTEVGANRIWAGRLPENLQKRIREELSPDYDRLDPSVRYAIWAAREAVRLSDWVNLKEVGVNVGSSRGATTLWEAYYQELNHSGAVGAKASPSTTLGNIASWVAHDIGSSGIAMSHSITCSSALHAVLNGCAWLASGLSERFLAGGSEAPLTPFTVAQMEALKIYSAEAGPYPCRSMDPKKTTNTMVLGEGAGMVCLESGVQPGARGLITGMGYATEQLKHGASLTEDARCLQRSMKKALSGIPPASVDAVVLHAPGTLKGDLAEIRAIESVFGTHEPLMYSNKWKIGHTFGASGMFNLEMALLLLEGVSITGPQYLPRVDPHRPVHRVLINTVGFGGNAVSLLVEKA